MQVRAALVLVPHDTNDTLAELAAQPGNGAPFPIIHSCHHLWLRPVFFDRDRVAQHNSSKRIMVLPDGTHLPALHLRSGFRRPLIMERA